MTLVVSDVQYPEDNALYTCIVYVSDVLLGESNNVSANVQGMSDSVITAGGYHTHSAVISPHHRYRSMVISMRYYPPILRSVSGIKLRAHVPR